jgi:NitT/TauT family transport system substrate-binding protein
MWMDVRPRFRGLIALMAVAAVALGVAACGGGSSDTTGSDSSSAEATTGSSGDSSSMTNLNVAAMPIANTLPLFYGIESGIFEQHGLNVSVTEVATSADGIAAAVSGDSPIAYSGITSLIGAAAKGLPVKAIANATLYTPGTSGVLASPDSGIEKPADLNGKKVAISGFESQTDLFLQAAGDALGADSKTINAVVVPFPEMPAALESGQVDAAWMTVPFYAGAVEKGAVPVLTEPIKPVFGTIKNVSQDVYLTTDSFLESDPETVAAFREAINEASEYVQDNPKVIGPTLASYTAFSEKEAAELQQPIFSPVLDTEVNQKWADTMLEYDFVEEPVELAEFVETGE